GERHFSLISPTETKTKYTNFNARNLLEWTNEWNRLTSTVKIAWLNEQYEYYSNLLAMSNYGTAETFIAKYDANYQIGSNMQVNALIDYVKTDGDGSDLADAAREVGSIAVLFRHRPTAIFGYELG